MLFRSLTLQHKEMLKKAMRIKNYYNKRGYICFLHGQAPNRFILQLLIKEMAEIRSPEKHTKKPFVYFRSEKFYKQQQNQYTDQLIEVLKTNITNDNVQRDDVMSVDAYFANLSHGESANYWCKESRSVTPLPTTGSSDLDPLLEGLPEGAIMAIKKQITQLMRIFSKNAPCGNLYVIAVPADKVMNYSYPAQPWGIYCNCRSDKETFRQLVEANHGIAPKCTMGEEVVTQWRDRKSVV